MRYVRRVQYVFILVLFILDLVVQAIWNQFGLPFGFVSQMAFMGLLLSSRNDVYTNYLPRYVMLAIIMDVFHYQSFPIYLLSYGIAMVVIKYWYRHVGSSMFEWIVMMIIGLFIRELVTYIVLTKTQSYIGSFIGFIADRGFWIILGNAFLFPIVKYIHSIFNRIIFKHARQDYVSERRGI